jgi:hypothetical protein
VIAVAGAAFVFSYDGLHAVALVGGVSAKLARYYPGLFDAVLVIACVAAVVFRDGRWLPRLWAWVVAVVVLAAIGAADVLHAINYTLPHRPTEAAAAVAPVVAILLAFSLLVTLLRQGRTLRVAPAGGDAERAGAPTVEIPAIDEPAPPTVIVPALQAPPVPGSPPRDAEPRAENIRYASQTAARTQPLVRTPEDTVDPDDNSDAAELTGLVWVRSPSAPPTDDSAADD